MLASFFHATHFFERAGDAVVGIECEKIPPCAAIKWAISARVIEANRPATATRFPFNQFVVLGFVATCLLPCCAGAPDCHGRIS